jgi:hypothetical protein
VPLPDDPHELLGRAEFNRKAWREGLEEFDPAARAEVAAVTADHERLKPVDVDRIVAGNTPLCPRGVHKLSACRIRLICRKIE